MRSRATVEIRGIDVLKHAGTVCEGMSLGEEDKKMVLHPLGNSEQEEGKNTNENRQLVLILTLVGILLIVYGLMAAR